MELDKLVKYRPQTGEALLDRISGTFSAGGATFLIGPSGSGKSSLLRLLNRLDEPDGGTIRFQGKALTEWEAPVLRRKVALVFQKPAPLPGTVLENMEFAASLHGLEGGEVSREWLRRVDLSEKTWNQAARELSGGELQRLALARVLQGKPEFLLLDEATSALDPTGVRDVEEVLLSLNREKGMGIIWVSHDPEQVRRVAQEVWALGEGRLIGRGNPREVLELPKVRLFFGKGGLS